MVVYHDLPWKLLYGNGHAVHWSFRPSMVSDLPPVTDGFDGLTWFVRWGLIVALIIAAIFLPFVVTVYAITGFVPNIQNLVQVSFNLG